MRPLSRSTLAQLVVWAQERDLLDNHRFLDRFLYLELGEQRFVFDDQMARTFLMGLLAGYARQQAG